MSKNLILNIGVSNIHIMIVISSNCNIKCNMYTICV